jgi:hypothetical protein
MIFASSEVDVAPVATAGAFPQPASRSGPAATAPAVPAAAVRKPRLVRCGLAGEP